MLCLRFSACSVLHTPRPSQDRRKCIRLNSPYHGRPVEAGACGEEKDTQESVITRLLRHGKLASPTSSYTCPCAPSNGRVGCLSHDGAHGLVGNGRAAEGCLTRLSVQSPPAFPN